MLKSADTDLSKKQYIDKKAKKIATMFDDIANRYDLANRVLSWGMDIRWRKKGIAIAQNLLIQKKNIQVLDIATGTADLAIESIRLSPKKIVGVDISNKMLEIGRGKISKKKLNDKIVLLQENVEDLSFENDTFDLITVGFGVRNFENLKKGLQNMYRVLKKDGILLIIEFSKPKFLLFKYLYQFYSKNILPNIGAMLSKRKDAYQYLPESIKNFPSGNEMISILSDANYKEVSLKQLTFGICTIYVAKK